MIQANAIGLPLGSPIFGKIQLSQWKYTAAPSSWSGFVDPVRGDDNLDEEEKKSNKSGQAA